MRNFFFFFTGVLFIIAKTWKQPEYPTRGDWLSILWQIHMMGCYVAYTSRVLGECKIDGQNEFCKKKNIRVYSVSHFYKINTHLV